LHLADTPMRVARMYAELLNGMPFDFTTFPAEGSQMVTVANIPFSSFCAHHFLPFRGVAHVGYVPCHDIAGLSKLARAVQHLSARPQVQERLTEQIADMLDDKLSPLGLGVVLEARHDCMELRGVRSIGSITRTSALRGYMMDRPDARAEFFAMIPPRTDL
jgi:GTP cyclohydrolase I